MRNKVHPILCSFAACLILAPCSGFLTAAPQTRATKPSNAKADGAIADAPSSPARTHTVREGDNLWDLARHYRTTVEELQELNRLKSNRLRIGQVLQLSGPPVAPLPDLHKTAIRPSKADAAGAISNAPSSPARTHTVREGDNLWDLARHYRTSVEELRELNRLKSGRLRIGQVLQLPGPPVAPLPDFLKQRLAAAAGLGRQDVSSASSTPDKLPSMAPQAQALHETSDSEAPRSLLPAGSADPEQTREQPAENPIPPLMLREQMIVAGFSFLGVRYRWNGMSEKRGFDCSGLVKRLFSLFSIDVPRSSREQFKVGEKIARAALEIGDLVFFSSRGGKIPNHVGIYIGADQFLHAASRGKKVMVSKLTDEWYSRRFIGARRILDLWKDENRIADTKGN